MQGEKSVWQTPTDGTPMLVPIPPSVKLEPVSKTRHSRESLEQVVDGDFRKQLELSALLDELGRVEIRIQDVVVNNDETEFALRRSGAKGQDAKISDAHPTWFRWFECKRAVP